MRCPFCRGNFTLQGPFCPLCGRRIIGPNTGEVADDSAPSDQAPMPPAPPPGPFQPPRPTNLPSPPPPFPGPGRGAHPGGDDDDVLVVELEGAGGPSFPRPGAATPQPAVAAPTQPVDQEHLAKTCPYCRFPLKVSEQMTICPACGVAHHADCWHESGGCTTYGCRFSPESHPPDAEPVGGRGAGPATAGYPTGRPPTPQGPSPTPGWQPQMVPPSRVVAAARLEADATNALIASLLGLFCCGILSLAGLAMAISVLVRMSTLGVKAPAARTRAIAAIVLGIVIPVASAVWFYYVARNYPGVGGL